MYKIDPKKSQNIIELIKNNIKSDVEKQQNFLQEIDDFTNYIIKNNMLDEFVFTDTEFSLYSLIMDYSQNYVNLFNYYDETFNTEIIIRNLLEVENITQTQLFNLIIYFLKKFKNMNAIRFLREYGDPIENLRSLIIKKYYEPHSSRNNLPILSSNKDNYNINTNNVLDYILYKNANFKNDIVNKNFSDGYDFYWNEPDNNIKKKDSNNCSRYLVQILNPEGEPIIMMTVTKSPKVEGKQVHFYIKKSLIFECKYAIGIYTQDYKNLSLMLHSFATYIFNANTVYSNLMPSMENIFKKNNVTVIDIPKQEDEDIQQLHYCLRLIKHQINIDVQFRNLWLGNGLYTSQDISDTIGNENIKLYKLVKNNSNNNSNSSISTLNNKTCAENFAIASSGSGSGSGSSLVGGSDKYYFKYLKYKKKYLQLINKKK
jgi:hypothetical protein